MAKFYTIVPPTSLAAQIADMINKYNRWYKKYNAYSLIASNVTYVVELERDKVIACAGLIRLNHNTSKIMHICVLPDYRGKGIGKKITQAAMGLCETEFVCMTIREDNAASMALATSLNFGFIRKQWFKDHFTNVLGRKCKNDGNS
jgi:RimJ/RimL family protein N-acetyltransferase